MFWRATGHVRVVGTIDRPNQAGNDRVGERNANQVRGAEHSRARSPSRARSNLPFQNLFGLGVYKLKFYYFINLLNLKVLKF